MRKMTNNSKVSPDWKINEVIKSGLWRDIYTNIFYTKNILDDTADLFELIKYVSDRLEFHYVAYK